MPAIARKAKALGGKGVVLSYVDKPENFYWREQISLKNEGIKQRKTSSTPDLPQLLDYINTGH